MELPQSAKSDEKVQLVEDKENTVSILITYQTNHKAENLDIDADADEAKKQAEVDDLDRVQRQYPNLDPSVYETFLANSIELPFENQPVKVQNELHMRKCAREDHSCRVNHAPPNNINTLLENAESYDSEGVEHGPIENLFANHCHTGMEERRCGEEMCYLR